MTTTDPTLWKYPKLHSPNRTIHIDNLERALNSAQIERDEALVAKDFANLACEKLEARLQEARQLLAEYGLSYRFTEDEWANWESRRVAFIVSAHTPTK